MFKLAIFLTLIINCAYMNEEVLSRNYENVSYKDMSTTESRIEDKISSKLQDLKDKDNKIYLNSEQNHGVKRRLATSASMSTISGNGLQSIAAGTVGTINVTSRDSSGNLVGTGGDTWIVKITNECTKENDYTCVGVTGAANTLSSAISGIMTDKGDGTYTYSYTISTTGKVSVQVYLNSAHGCFVEYNASSDFSGASCGSGIESDISRDYGSGEVACGRLDNTSLKITTTILAPYTGTYTFTLNYDDGADVYLDGTMFLNQLGTGCNCVQTVTKDLVAGNYYPFYAKWGEIGGGALFKVSWAYGSVSSTLIPTSAQSLTLLGGSSPYTITMLNGLCGDGYITSTETCDDANVISGEGCDSSCAIESGWTCKGEPSVCQKCGNKIREGTEVCDDGNLLNGDGCSSVCAIEDNGVCINESSKLRYNCRLCDVDWTPDSTKDYCVTDEITSGILPFSSMYISLLCIGIFINFMLVIFFKYSSYGMIMMFSHFQMFMLTPLIGAYIPKIVIDFYRNMYGMIFNFWFISDRNVFFNYNKTFGKYDYGHEWYLHLIKIESYSALSNMGKLIWIFMWLVVVYLIIGVAWFIMKMTAQNTQVYKIANYLFQFMKNSVFMRFFILSYCFMWLACMTEIGMADNPSNHRSSYIFSMITLVALVVFLLLSFVACGFSSNNEWYKKMNFIHELFSGMKDDWKFRSFSVVSLLRTASFAIIVCSTYDKSMYLTLSLMVGVQLVFLVYLIILRPHSCFKDTFIEIVNEIILILGLVFLYLLDRRSRWTTAVAWIYISCLMFCVVVYFCFTFGTLIYQLWKLDETNKRNRIIEEMKNAVVGDEHEEAMKSTSEEGSQKGSNNPKFVSNPIYANQS